MDLSKCKNHTMTSADFDADDEYHISVGEPAPGTSGTQAQSTSKAGDQEKHKAPKCARCRNHGISATKKGHKSCPFLHCPCHRCRLNDRRRQLNMVQRQSKFEPWPSEKMHAINTSITLSKLERVDRLTLCRAFLYAHGASAYRILLLEESKMARG